MPTQDWGRAHWFKTHRHHVHLDCHLPSWPLHGLEKFDADQWAGNFARAGVNVVAVFAKCHFGNAYYPTRFGNAHPRLPADMLGEAIRACHERDIKVLCYYSLCADYRAQLANPGWRAKQADGTDTGYMGLFGATLCPNTPYGDELVIPQLEEIAQNYDPDGWFIDIPLNSSDLSGCFCDWCKAKFAARFERELAPDLPWETRAQWCEAATIRILRALRAISVQYCPEAVICSNRAWRMGTGRAWSELCDFGVMESQPGHGGAYQSHSIRLRHARTLPVPVQVMTVRFYSGWGDMTLKPVAQQQYEYGLMVAHGGIVSTGDQVENDGTVQDAAYDALAEALGYVAAREPFATEARTLRHGAVLINGRWQQPPPELSGAERALAESHCQFDLLQLEDLGRLDDYRWAVVTEGIRLTPAQQDVVRQFVVDGGNLLVAGHGGGVTETGDFALGDILGVKLLGRATFSLGHLDPAGGELEGLPQIPLLVKRPLLEIAPVAACAVLPWRYPIGQPSPPERTFRSPYPPAGRRCPHPAVTFCDRAGGTVVYVAFDLFTEYHQCNHAWDRQLVQALMKLVDPAPPYRIEGCRHLSANLMTTDDRWFLHLVHAQMNLPGGGGYQPIEATQPLADVVVELRCKPKAITLQPEGEPLPYEQSDGICRVTIPKLGMYHVLEINLG